MVLDAEKQSNIYNWLQEKQKKLIHKIIYWNADN